MTQHVRIKSVSRRTVCMAIGWSNTVRIGEKVLVTVHLHTVIAPYIFRTLYGDRTSAAAGTCGITRTDRAPPDPTGRPGMCSTFSTSREEGALSAAAFGVSRLYSPSRRRTENEDRGMAAVCRTTPRLPIMFPSLARCLHMP